MPAPSRPRPPCVWEGANIKPSVKFGVPGLVLAPMEGVTDFPMRQLMTRWGGFSHSVSEFIRVAHEVPPAKVFFRYVPELRSNACTKSGTPVQVQILGGDPERMAAAALTAIACGAEGIDINFGCPAPTVNRHDGGATLLKFPDRLEKIVRAVRDAVPAEFPVSAKLRLGWEDRDDIFLNAERAERGGASWITIHGRTRVQGYAPPIDWIRIGEVRKASGVPIIANGDIWSLDDFELCREITGCEHFMLGRGAIGDPLLTHRIHARLHGLTSDLSFDWPDLLNEFVEVSRTFYSKPGYTIRRIKQWGNIAAKVNGADWFHLIKGCETLEELPAKLGRPQLLWALTPASASHPPPSASGFQTN